MHVLCREVDTPYETCCCCLDSLARVLLIQRQVICTVLTYLCATLSYERSEDTVWFYPLFKYQIPFSRRSWLISRGCVHLTMAGWRAVQHTTTGIQASVLA